MQRRPNGGWQARITTYSECRNPQQSQCTRRLPNSAPQSSEGQVRVTGASALRRAAAAASFRSAIAPAVRVSFGFQRIIGCCELLKVAPVPSRCHLQLARRLLELLLGPARAHGCRSAARLGRAPGRLPAAHLRPRRSGLSAGARREGDDGARLPELPGSTDICSKYCMQFSGRLQTIRHTCAILCSAGFGSLWLAQQLLPHTFSRRQSLCPALSTTNFCGSAQTVLRARQQQHGSIQFGTGLAGDRSYVAQSLEPAALVWSGCPKAWMAAAVTRRGPNAHAEQLGIDARGSASRALRVHVRPASSSRTVPEDPARDDSRLPAPAGAK